MRQGCRFDHNQPDLTIVRSPSWLQSCSHVCDAILVTIRFTLVGDAVQIAIDGAALSKITYIRDPGRCSLDQVHTHRGCRWCCSPVKFVEMSHPSGCHCRCSPDLIHTHQESGCDCNLRYAREEVATVGKIILVASVNGSTIEWVSHSRFRSSQRSGGRFHRNLERFARVENTISSQSPAFDNRLGHHLGCNPVHKHPENVPSQSGSHSSGTPLTSQSLLSRGQFHRIWNPVGVAVWLDRTGI